MNLDMIIISETERCFTIQFSSQTFQTAPKSCTLQVTAVMATGEEGENLSLKGAESQLSDFTLKQKPPHLMSGRLWMDLGREWENRINHWMVPYSTPLLVTIAPSLSPPPTSFLYTFPSVFPPFQDGVAVTKREKILTICVTDLPEYGGELIKRG